MTALVSKNASVPDVTLSHSFRGRTHAPAPEGSAAAVGFYSIEMILFR